MKLNIKNRLYIIILITMFLVFIIVSFYFYNNRKNVVEIDIKDIYSPSEINTSTNANFMEENNF